MQNKKINIIDTTLYDGSYAVSHSFTQEQAKDLVCGLDAAGVDIIEVNNGDGISDSPVNYGFLKNLGILEASGRVVKNARLAVPFYPGVGNIDDLKRARDCGASVVRIGTHVTEAAIATAHIRWAKQNGMFVCGVLMMSHMGNRVKIVEQANTFAEAGADYINLADSTGHMIPEDVRSRVAAIKNSIDLPVGFHAHNNLGMAVANTLAAVEAGAEYVDATCRGLGPGAGNTQTEVICTILKRQGWNIGVDIYDVMDVAEDIVEPIVLHQPQIIRTESLMLGYAGVYSSFLLQTRKAAEKFGLASRDILVELGRRHMLGSQENMIADVAYELSCKR